MVRRIRVYVGGLSRALVEHRGVTAVPHRRPRRRIVGSGQAGRSWHPEVAPSRQRAAVGARALEQRVHVLAANPVRAAHAHGGQHSVVDPVADRLRRDLEALGDLGNGQEL